MANMHVIITKEFTFRGKPERFSNGYTFQAATPTSADPAKVQAIADQLILMERNFHSTNVKFVYVNGGPWGQDSVYVAEYPTPQTGMKTPTGMHQETCVLAQTKLGPRRYLTKYYHVCYGGASGQPGDLAPAQVKADVEGAIVLLTNGTLPDGLKVCSNKDNAIPAQPFTCDPFLRTHQLKARGKRPTPG